MSLSRRSLFIGGSALLAAPAIASPAPRMSFLELCRLAIRDVSVAAPIIYSVTRTVDKDGNGELRLVNMRIAGGAYVRDPTAGETVYTIFSGYRRIA